MCQRVFLKRIITSRFIFKLFFREHPDQWKNGAVFPPFSILVPAAAQYIMVLFFLLEDICRHFGLTFEFGTFGGRQGLEIVSSGPFTHMLTF